MHYSQLLLNPVSRQLLDAYLQRPSHGLLLSGPVGVGLATIAHAVATELVKHPSDIQIVTPDEKGTISIETVRSLYVSTRDIRTSHQVVVVDECDAMSLDAQNAFLKLLEEPTPQTVFLLTSHAPQRLLATIISRLTPVTIRPISDQISQRFVRSPQPLGDAIERQLLFMGSGLPAELTRLIGDPEYFSQQAGYVTTARQLLQSKPHERLVLVGRYSDRTQALLLLEALSKLIEFMLGRQPDTPLLKSAALLEETLTRLHANGHVRTQLMNLVLHLP